MTGPTRESGDATTDHATRADAGAAARIEPVRPTAAHELVVDQVRRAIQLGRFVPGDKLPPERQLARQLGVSRTTVREAARVLETEGLLESRRGAAGGLIVCRPTLPEATLRDTVREQRGAIRAVFDFRIANEAAAAPLAAEHRTDADLAALGTLLSQMGALTATAEVRTDLDNIPRFIAADSAFHLGIARAARNAYMLRAIEDARAAMFLPIGAVFRRLEDNANDFHEAIFAALKNRKPEAAESAMRTHLDASRQSVEDFLAHAS
jgi:DNA-binding FadR family transcriptional regulator